MIEVLALDHNGEVVKFGKVITSQFVTPQTVADIVFALLSRPDVKTVVSNKRGEE